MRILLTTLNSKYVHSCPALKYIYSVIISSGADITMQEFTINNDKSYIYTEIVRGAYDLICISCYIWNIEYIKELGSYIKKACPDTKILVGGPEVSYNACQFLEENSWADFVVKGEGEMPFLEMSEIIKNGGDDFSSVNGITSRQGGEFRDNPCSSLIPMDKVPFPYHVFPLEEDRVIYYESARGCPYRCSYCLSSIDKSVRQLSVERTCRDLQYFLDNNVKQVKFIDRTFNCNVKRACEIWDYLIKRDNGVTNFHFEICSQLINDECIDIISKARKGLFQFEIGIQSTNQKTLDAVDRRDNIDAVLGNVTRLLKLGNSHIHVDLIAGLPYEDYKTFARSFNRVYALGADNLQLGFLKLLKGTKIFLNASEHQYVFRERAPYEVISNRYMSATDLVKLKMIENVLDLYVNKGGFEKTMAYIVSAVAPTPFNFFEQLADFFYTEGFQHRSHKKEDLYRIMMKFAGSRQNTEPGFEDKIKELLTADLENRMNPDAVKKFHRKGWTINGN